MDIPRQNLWGIVTTVIGITFQTICDKYLPLVSAIIHSMHTSHTQIKWHFHASFIDHYHVIMNNKWKSILNVYSQTMELMSCSCSLFYYCLWAFFENILIRIWIDPMRRRKILYFSKESIHHQYIGVSNAIYNFLNGDNLMTLRMIKSERNFEDFSSLSSWIFSISSD